MRTREEIEEDAYHMCDSDSIEVKSMVESRHREEAILETLLDIRDLLTPPKQHHEFNLNIMQDEDHE